MNPTEYGLVFKYKGRCWLARYLNEQGEIDDAVCINDPEEVYKDLTPWELSMVQIIEPQQDVYSLKDLKTVTIQNEQESTRNLNDLIQDGGFPDLAATIFETLTVPDVNDDAPLV